MTADLAVAIYRAIPIRLRAALWGRWFPTPTSHLYRPGMGWAGIGALTGDSKVPRPPMPQKGTMKIKRKTLAKMEAELAHLREVAATRVRLLTPGRVPSPPNYAPEPDGVLLDTTMESLYFIRRYGGYGLYLAHKYGVGASLTVPPAEWITGPVRLLVGHDAESPWETLAAVGLRGCGADHAGPCVREPEPA